MILRLWCGRVRAPDADAYRDYQLEVGPPGYRSVEGNRAILVLERRLGPLHEIGMLTLWSSWDAVRAFAGDPVDRARYYDRDPDFLVDPPELVEHFDVRSSFDPTPWSRAEAVEMWRAACVPGTTPRPRSTPPAVARERDGSLAVLLLHRLPTSRDGGAGAPEIATLSAWPTRRDPADRPTALEVELADGWAARTDRFDVVHAEVVT